jgi:hypothetical protein
VFANEHPRSIKEKTYDVGILENSPQCDMLGGLSITPGRHSLAINKISKYAHIPFCNWSKHGDMWGIWKKILETNMVVEISNNIRQGRKTSAWINDRGQRLWVFIKKHPTTQCSVLKTKSYKFGI